MVETSSPGEKYGHPGKCIRSKVLSSVLKQYLNTTYTVSDVMLLLYVFLKHWDEGFPVLNIEGHLNVP